MRLSPMTDQDTFLVGDIVVTVRRNARRKRLSLEVSQEGVSARAPMKMRLSTIVEFVETKQAWLQTHINALPQPKPPVRFETGELVDVFGDSLELRVMAGQSGKPIVDHGKLLLPVKQSHLDLEVTVKNKLINWYKKLALQTLEDSIEHFAPLMEVPANKRLSINVRDYKRRWGSCDQKGDLSFNWRIAQAPLAVFDYVVVHELAHCHEFNHSKRFWSIVAQHMPDWKEQQHWLSQHGADLYRI